MKRSLLITFLCLAYLVSSAQVKQLYGSKAAAELNSASELAFKDNRLEPFFIKLAEDAGILETDLELYLEEELSIDPNFSLAQRNSMTDDLGFTNTRYYVQYNSIPIEMAWMVVHSKNGLIHSINGNFLVNANLSGEVLLDEKTAIESAIEDIDAQTFKWQIKGEEELLKRETQDASATYYPKGQLVWMNASLDITQELKLCYKFNIYAHEPLGRYGYYVDASNGEIVYVETMIHTGDKPGIAHTGYSGIVTIMTDSVSNYFRLREIGRGKGIETYDLNKSTTYANAVDFIDSNNVWNGFSPAIDKYGTDAHFGTEMTYDYFSLIHNRSSIDGNGFTLRSYVDYNNNYVNAFWDGQRMTYGDGGIMYTPLTTLDICGHEVVHGLTDYTSDLIYANESGALNESFSDIFGVCVESYARPNNWNWLVGEDIGAAFRSLSDPNRFNDPDTYDGRFWVNQNCSPSSGNDYCGVHSNSGVQNYWFFLLANGGSGVNDLGDSYNVNGLGIINAARIAYRNNTVYLGRSSNFIEARFYAIKAATDLFGACSPEVEEVTNAWYAVGVGNAYNPNVSADFVAVKDTSFCTSPAQVRFDSDGSNVLRFQWSFGDGSSSTLADPSHFYANYGDYDVQLIADGGACGSDTVVKQNYIRIDSSVRCSYFMGSDRAVNECTGTLYDNGGLNGEYGFNSQDTFTISSPTGDYIAYFIEKIDLENGDKTFCNHDYIEVFDGEAGGTLIGKYCGNNLPPDSILSSGNMLTIVFSSDQRKSFGGFISYWECRNAVSLPIADFTIPLDTLCNAEVSFYEASSGVINSWLWNFGDGKTSTERNPTHFYENDGTYTISLTVSNSIGSDQMVMSDAITVSRLTPPSVSSDTACFGGRVKLGAGGAGPLEWYDASTNGNLVYNQDTLRINNLQKDTSYYVQYVQRPAPIRGPFAINGNGYFSDSSEAMYFDVYEPMILESVILNSNRLGVRKIELRNSNGKIIASKSMSVSGVPQQVQLGFVIYPDSNYSLALGSPYPSLYVNTTGATYPYNFGNYMSLTGNSMGPNAYPFFYFWTIRPLSCFSSRAKVEAKVDTTCVITAINEVESSTRLSIYPNPSDNSFFVNSSVQSGLEIEVFTIDGKLMLRKILPTENTTEGIGEELPPALYLINIRAEDQIEQFKWVKTR